MQKLNLQSLQNQKTASQITIEKIQDLTSFPQEMCKQQYAQLSENLTNEEIVSHFEQLNQQQIDRLRVQKDSVNDLLNYDFKSLNESQHQEYFINTFKGINDVHSKLNITKSLMQNVGADDAILQPLFEGIQHDLSYVSKNFQPDNMYEIIMQNVNRIVQQNELKKVMVQDDNVFYLHVLNSVFSGMDDGFYTNISNIEKTISDTQTLLFDLTLFVNKFIESKEYDLKFVNTKTVREYNHIANELIKNIYGSFKASRIIDKQFINEPDTNNPYSVITQLTGKLDEKYFISIQVDLYQINHKAVNDVLRLIKSMTHLFKQPTTRRLISNFVTKASQLVSDVNKSNQIRKMAGF